MDVDGNNTGGKMRRKIRKAKIKLKPRARAVVSKKAQKSSGSVNERVKALVRAQEMNEMLKRSIIESEALQSSGDDRPLGEEHISDLLNEKSDESVLYKRVGKDLPQRGAMHMRRKGQSRRSGH